PDRQPACGEHRRTGPASPEPDGSWRSRFALPRSPGEGMMRPGVVFAMALMMSCAKGPAPDAVERDRPRLDEDENDAAMRKMMAGMTVQPSGEAARASPSSSTAGPARDHRASPSTRATTIRRNCLPYR